MSLPVLILLLFGFPVLRFSSVHGYRDLRRNLADSVSAQCPLNFRVLQKFADAAKQSNISDVSLRCQLTLQGLHLVEAQYLKTNGLFLPPLNSSEACWDDYESLIHEIFPNFNVRSTCGFETGWISQGCMNITSLSQFEAVIPESSRQHVRRSCNQSLENNSPCSSCTISLSNLRSFYLPGPSVGNVTDCSAYPFIYAAGVVNWFGPADDGTALCLFLLNSPSSSKKNIIAWVFGLVVACVALFAGLTGLAFLLWWKKKKKKKKKKKLVARKLLIERTSSSPLACINSSATLVKFTFEEIKAATGNFSRYNIIGKGSYGNVYKGVMADGSEVALKRFKNCSSSGDASFAHEVEVIASVRHRNLVALRGFCTATPPLEGHQRIIVCDLMRNGSLHDHLFGSPERKLDWPIRQKIAIGMARGLSYLHFGAQPAIIHRDIKASNILLDESFEPKVADFGLAKFTPEGMTHLSTRVAGTLGYVAPEYALYGQLTEKSDVYSFGVVLLELLSGKKALVSTNEAEPFLVTDWAWSLVRKGKVLDVIEEGMADLDPSEVLEKYVLVAVVSSHPQMHARPTMDQVLKILESDMPIPLIPDHPIPLLSHIEDIERSVSSSRSGHLSSSGGYNPFHFDDDILSSNVKEIE